MVRIRRKREHQCEDWIKCCTVAGIKPNAVVFTNHLPKNDDVVVYIDSNTTKRLLPEEWYSGYFDQVKRCIVL